jgi:hypothetical protein
MCMSSTLTTVENPETKLRPVGNSLGRSRNAHGLPDRSVYTPQGQGGGPVAICHGNRTINGLTDPLFLPWLHCMRCIVTGHSFHRGLLLHLQSSDLRVLFSFLFFLPIFVFFPYITTEGKERCSDSCAFRIQRAGKGILPLISSSETEEQSGTSC